MYNTLETSKLDPKFRKCIFLKYVDEVKGYYLWDLITYKVIISRDIIFTKDTPKEKLETTTVQIEER